MATAIEIIRTTRLQEIRSAYRFKIADFSSSYFMGTGDILSVNVNNDPMSKQPDIRINIEGKIYYCFLCGVNSPLGFFIDRKNIEKSVFVAGKTHKSHSNALLVSYISYDINDSKIFRDLYPYAG